MRTIEQLRQAGFTVEVSERGIDCVDVRSPNPFWYYNINFYESMSEVHSNLQAAQADARGYLLTVAGTQWLEPAQVFPFNLLDEKRKAILDEARSRYVVACNEGQRAQDDYLDALRTDEPYES